MWWQVWHTAASNLYIMKNSAGHSLLRGWFINTLLNFILLNLKENLRLCLLKLNTLIQITVYGHYTGHLIPAPEHSTAEDTNLTMILTFRNSVSTSEFTWTHQAASDRIQQLWLLLTASFFHTCQECMSGPWLLPENKVITSNKLKHSKFCTSIQWGLSLWQIKTRHKGFSISEVLYLTKLNVKSLQC
jgi:hypothetical protein